MHVWRTLVVLGALSVAVTACEPTEQETGSGGGPQPVASARLPQSNNVNPTPKPDTYIDEESKRREEKEKAQKP